MRLFAPWVHRLEYRATNTIFAELIDGFNNNKAHEAPCSGSRRWQAFGRRQITNP